MYVFVALLLEAVISVSHTWLALTNIRLLQLLYLCVSRIFEAIDGIYYIVESVFKCEFACYEYNNNNWTLANKQAKSTNGSKRQ